MITKELLPFTRLIPNCDDDLGTKKHLWFCPVNVTWIMRCRPSIYISVHGGKWYVSFFERHVVVFATEAECCLLIAASDGRTAYGLSP